MIQQNLMQQTIHISRLTGRVRRVRMILFRDIRKWSIMQRANIYDNCCKLVGSERLLFCVTTDVYFVCYI